MSSKCKTSKSCGNYDSSEVDQPVHPAVLHVLQQMKTKAALNCGENIIEINPQLPRSVEEASTSGTINSRHLDTKNMFQDFSDDDLHEDFSPDISVVSTAPQAMFSGTKTNPLYFNSSNEPTKLLPVDNTLDTETKDRLKIRSIIAKVKEEIEEEKEEKELEDKIAALVMQKRKQGNTSFGAVKKFMKKASKSEKHNFVNVISKAGKQTVHQYLETFVQKSRPQVKQTNVDSHLKKLDHHYNETLCEDTTFVQKSSPHAKNIHSYSMGNISTLIQDEHVNSDTHPRDNSCNNLVIIAPIISEERNDSTKNDTTHHEFLSAESCDLSTGSPDVVIDNCVFDCHQGGNPEQSENTELQHAGVNCGEETLPKLDNVLQIQPIQIIPDCNTAVGQCHEPLPFITPSAVENVGSNLCADNSQKIRFKPSKIKGTKEITVKTIDPETGKLVIIDRLPKRTTSVIQKMKQPVKKKRRCSNVITAFNPKTNSFVRVRTDVQVKLHDIMCRKKNVTSFWKMPSKEQLSFTGNFPLYVDGANDEKTDQNNSSANNSTLINNLYQCGKSNFLSKECESNVDSKLRKLDHIVNYDQNSARGCSETLCENTSFEQNVCSDTELSGDDCNSEENDLENNSTPIYDYAVCDSFASQTENNMESYVEDSCEDEDSSVNYYQSGRVTEKKDDEEYGLGVEGVQSTTSTGMAIVDEPFPEKLFVSNRRGMAYELPHSQDTNPINENDFTGELLTSHTIKKGNCQVTTYCTVPTEFIQIKKEDNFTPGENISSQNKNESENDSQMESESDTELQEDINIGINKCPPDSHLEENDIYVAEDDLKSNPDQELQRKDSLGRPIIHFCLICKKKFNNKHQVIDSVSYFFI